MTVYITFKFTKGAEFQNELSWYLYTLSEGMSGRGCILAWILEGDNPCDIHHKLNWIIEDLYARWLKCRVEREEPRTEIKDGEVIRLIIEK